MVSHFAKELTNEKLDRVAILVKDGFKAKAFIQLQPQPTNVSNHCYVWRIQRTVYRQVLSRVQKPDRTLQAGEPRPSKRQARVLCYPTRYLRRL